MITIYYKARHATRAGEVQAVLEDETDSDINGHPDFCSVSAPTREDLIEQLTDEIRVWSRWSMNAERAWEVKWRENAIAYIS